MKSTLHLKVINGMHALPSQQLAYGVNTINENPDISVKVSCTGKMGKICAGKITSELVNKVIDLSEGKMRPLEFTGYEMGSRFNIEITGKDSRGALLELKRKYIDWLSLEQIFVY